MNPELPRDFAKGPGMNIVERLRAQREADFDGVCTEAADTIEALAEALRDCIVALDHTEQSLCVRVNPPTLENARAALRRVE